VLVGPAHPSALSLWILLGLECAALALRGTDLDAGSAFFRLLSVLDMGRRSWPAPVVTGGLSTWSGAHGGLLTESL
jgi:hypothetical protein